QNVFVIPDLRPIPTLGSASQCVTGFPGVWTPAGESNGTISKSGSSLSLASYNGPGNPAQPSPAPQVATGGTPKSAQPPITIGSPAPALKIAKWFKGTPVDTFKEGQVYVVEFWATWCGPCKTSIPHITELAKKDAGKATFIGVSVFEHPTEPTNE